MKALICILNKQIPIKPTISWSKSTNVLTKLNYQRHQQLQHQNQLQFLQAIRRQYPDLYQKAIFNLQYHTNQPLQLSCWQCQQLTKYIVKQQTQQLQNMIQHIQHQAWYHTKRKD